MCLRKLGEFYEVKMKSGQKPNHKHVALLDFILIATTVRRVKIRLMF